MQERSCWVRFKEGLLFHGVIKYIMTWTLIARWPEKNCTQSSDTVHTEGADGDGECTLIYVYKKYSTFRLPAQITMDTHRIISLTVISAARSHSLCRVHY
jgi:hypothetical protein